MNNGEKRENFVANLIAARGNRVTASILGYLDEQVYPRFDIPVEAKKKIRQVVLDQVNGFKDLAIDIVKSDTDHINDFYVQKMDEIHTAVMRLQKEQAAS